MKAYLDTQYGFDTFNIVNGKLLPEGFAGSCLDFQGANPARNGSLETGRSLRSGPLLRVNGYSTSLEYQTSLGRNQELKFDLKTELSGNIFCLDVAYGSGGFTRQWCRTVDQNWTTERTQLRRSDVVRIRWSVIVRNQGFVFWQTTPGSAWIDNLSFVSDPPLTLRTGDCCDRSARVRPGNSLLQ